MSLQAGDPNSLVGGRHPLASATVSEESLMRLCDEHYARTRRVATSLALPPGTIEQFQCALKLDRRFFPPCHLYRLVLFTPLETVTLEELPGLTAPTVLSDRSR